MPPTETPLSLSSPPMHSPLEAPHPRTKWPSLTLLIWWCQTVSQHKMLWPQVISYILSIISGIVTFSNKPFSLSSHYWGYPSFFFFGSSTKCPQHSPVFHAYLFWWKQQCLNWLKILEKLYFFNNMHSIFIANSFMQGSFIWNIQAIHLSKDLKEELCVKCVCLL